jgi:ribonuclease HI
MSWGAIVLHDDQHIELYGKRSKLISDKSGLHEYYAFTEAILYAHNRFGLEPADVTVYVDDQAIFTANTRAHQGLNLDASLSQFNALARNFDYSREQMDIVKTHLKKSRVVWYTRHNHATYALRCHALAIHARDNEGPPPTFEEWLKEGILRYTTSGEAFTTHFPFVHASEAK